MKEKFEIRENLLIREATRGKGAHNFPCLRRTLKDMHLNIQAFRETQVHFASPSPTKITLKILQILWLDAEKVLNYNTHLTKFF